MELTTQRLILREWTMEDFHEAHAYATDPEVVRYMSFGPNTEEDSRAFLSATLERARSTPRTDYGLAVTRREDGAFVGGVGLYLRNPTKAELGYVYKRAAWGNGYATEAARALVDFGFRALGLHRIYALCVPANTASARVMEKLGMRYEGCLRGNLFARGEFMDSLSYAVLAPVWRAESGA
jgi:RimJ/RimL family protein N-acetyltransferase